MRSLSASFTLNIILHYPMRFEFKVDFSSFSLVPFNIFDISPFSNLSIYLYKLLILPSVNIIDNDKK